MNRRLGFIAVLAALVLTVGLAWHLWSLEISDSALGLKIVRETVEAAKPVVFFQIEGEGRRRTTIPEVHQMIGETQHQVAVRPSQGIPLAQPWKGRREFGVVAPEATAMGKESGGRLQATVLLEESTLARVKRIMGVVRRYQRSHFSKSTFELVRFVWSEDRFVDRQSVTSDWITNTISMP